MTDPILRHLADRLMRDLDAAQTLRSEGLSRRDGAHPRIRAGIRFRAAR